MKQLRDRLIALRDHANQGLRNHVTVNARKSLALSSNDRSKYCLLRGKSLNFENLVKQLHTSLGSRSTVANVLEDYIYKKFMIKNNARRISVGEFTSQRRNFA